jgi:hypothetical protein
LKAPAAGREAVALSCDVRGYASGRTRGAAPADNLVCGALDLPIDSHQAAAWDDKRE